MRWLLICLMLVSCGGGSGTDAVIPASTSLRSDLYFGYYGGGNAIEALSHTNMLFESGLNGDEPQARNIEAAKLPTILDIGAQVYQGALNTDRTVNVNAESLLRARFDEFRRRDILKYIVALYPIDEPDLNVYRADVIRQANAVTRKIAAEYPELANVKLAVIYSNADKLFAVETFDWVGFDRYDGLSGILTNGEYARMMSKLRPDQRTIIVPGGAYGQDPIPFLNFAETHPEVIAIVPFIWSDFDDKKGIRSNGMAKAYCLAGMQVKYQLYPQPCNF